MGWIPSLEDPLGRFLWRVPSGDLCGGTPSGEDLFGGGSGPFGGDPFRGPLWEGSIWGIPPGWISLEDLFWGFLWGVPSEVLCGGIPLGEDPFGRVPLAPEQLST